MRVCFYTLGCKVNLNETGALEQMFRALASPSCRRAKKRMFLW